MRIVERKIGTRARSVGCSPLGSPDSRGFDGGNPEMYLTTRGYIKRSNYKSIKEYMEKKIVVNEKTLDSDLVTIQAQRGTRRELKMLASLTGENVPDYLANLIRLAYEARIANNKAHVKRE